MQSDFSKVTIEDSTTEPTENYQEPIHHGLDTQNEHTPSRLHHEASLGELSYPTNKAESAAAAATAYSDTGVEPFERLNSTLPFRRTGSPVDRIFEHERASTYPYRRRNEGPSFTVVQGAEKRKSDRINLTDFPNGLCSGVGYFQFC